MLSTSRQNGRQNSHDNVFEGLSVGTEEAGLVKAYLESHDFSDNTRSAIRNDLRKLVRWFNEANRETFRFERVTMRDVIDFRNHLHRDKKQAVASVNRALVLIRRLFDNLVKRSILGTNPAKQVKEIRKTKLPPVGLDRAVVRRLLREVELRADVRANAVFHLLLYTGARVGDVVNLDVADVMLSEKSGQAVFRHGKGNKERTVPLPLPCRKAMIDYLETRPPMESDRMFLGERGPLTAAGVQSLCRKYSAFVGANLHPHAFRHTYAKRFLEDNGNDLSSLALILGHSNIQTTARYAQQTEDHLRAASEKLTY